MNTVKLVMLGEGGVGKTAISLRVAMNYFDVRPHHREGEGFLVVYSTTSRASFDSVEKFCRQIARVKDSNRVPIVLVGNKIDRVHEREVETRHGEELARRLGCGFVETSAKTRENLEEVYCTAVRMIEQQRGGSTANPVKKKKKPRKCSIL
uniref:BY PROTMAP: gi/472584455/gb/EMS22049.1/ Ras GTPase [Rhodosporidium toruloides NP11] n=1 Tax=Rhodotorula toruloides TaxID=5286 RepID=A0A0K3CR12_RHOTO